MNRNVESHFAQLPAAEIQRSTFDRSCSYKTSFNVGDLIPFYVDEVLPGDTFDVTTAKVVRSQTMLTPVMDNIFLDTYYFFVPNRLVWEHWKEFCGENTQSAWAPTVKYSIPVIEGTVKQGSIGDYMGLPVGVAFNDTDYICPSALPFRAYALICNEFFRDENLSDPLNIPLGDANQRFPLAEAAADPINDVANGGAPFKAAKYHDYFTSALPAPQKGDPVTVPISFADSDVILPVVTGSMAHRAASLSVNPNGGGSPLQNGYQYGMLSHTNALKDMGGNALGSLYNYSDMDSVAPAAPIWNSNGFQNLVTEYMAVGAQTSTPNTSPQTIQNPGLNLFNKMDATSLDSSSYALLTPANLYAVGYDGASGSAGVTVNEMRLAFAMQRYLEALARSGSRYTEILLGLFGVRSPDARLQRPEYLGGNRIPINISEVSNTAQTETDFLGDLGAKSQTGDVNHDFTKSFTEHGYVIGLMVARYDHSYSQGIQRHWFRKTFEDFYNPKFAHLGEVPVYQAELMAYDDTGNLDNLGRNGSTPTVFGYQEIWAEYRYRPSMVTAEMRPGATNSLAHWHLADYYDTPPTLSDEWIREDKSMVDRVLAVTSDVSNQFWCDIYIKNKSTRPMPMYSVPGLIDHF